MELRPVRLTDPLAGGRLRRFAADTCEVERMWTAPAHPARRPSPEPRPAVL